MADEQRREWLQARIAEIAPDESNSHLVEQRAGFQAELDAMAAPAPEPEPESEPKPAPKRTRAKKA